MARATFVKSARKDNPVAKKGESYYWWKFRYGGKYYSKTPPRSSQLINSPFLSTMAAVEEKFSYDFDVDDARDAEELKSLVEDAVNEVREAAEEAQGSLDNMPEGLQQGPTGELLESRADEGESMADEYENVDLEDYDGPDVPTDGDIPEEFRDWIEGKLEELQNITYGGE